MCTALIQVVNNVKYLNQPPGSLVELYVEMRLGELKDSTLTSFRIWR
jgi:kynureninase